MRTPNATVSTILTLALIGCSSGGVVVVRRPPAPTPAPVVIVEPLEIDVARPHNGKLFVQTNRPAYVAIFEIVPDGGVALIYPGSSRQRRFVVSGLREVPVWWQASRVTYTRGVSSSRSQPTRYIYALASDEPLRIPDAAFQDGYLDRMIGHRGSRAMNPYAAMRALAREFVPSVGDEAWAEDAYGLSPSYATERYRVARVYCRGGTVYEVPAELADRVWCPTSPRGGADGPGRVSDVDVPGWRRPPVRPDSMVGDNGRRMATRPHGSNGRGPIDRVKEPVETENRGEGRSENDDRPGNGPTKNHPDNQADTHPARPNERVDDAPRPPRRAAMTDAKPVRARPAPTPEPVGKPEQAGKAEPAEKQEPIDKQAPVDKQESARKPEKTEGSENTPKPETAGQSEKPQSPGEESAEQKKGRGKPNASEEKPTGDKSKKPSGAKPLS